MAAQSTILLVDDDADIREAIRMTLEDEGYDVVEMGSGSEALEWLRLHPLPAVMLLDWNMAPMNGADVIAELARDARLADLPVVVVTADITAAQKLKGARHVDWLRKPFRLEELFETLRRHCA